VTRASDNLVIHPHVRTSPQSAFVHRRVGGRRLGLLAERLKPTELAPLSQRPVPIAPPTNANGRSRRVLLEVARWALVAIFFKLIGAWSAEGNAKTFRQMLERLGFLWVKVGQFLSLRADLFSDAFCKELWHLQYQAQGFPPELARSTIEAELGETIDRLFDLYEEAPFAAASIAQLHRACLKDTGTPVVIKVMRPGAEQIFAADMRVLGWIVALLRLIPRFKRYRLDEAVWEISEIAREETDFRMEMSNLQRFRRSVRPHAIYVPKVFDRFCTRHVLVMERVDGVLMSDFIRVDGAEPARVDRWLNENGCDRRHIAERLFLSFMRQLFEDNLFHGDLHPGNIMLLRHNRISMIDLGSIGMVEEGIRKRYYFGLKAIGMGEYEKAADLLLSLIPGPVPPRLLGAKEEIIRALRSWEKRTHVKALPYHEKSISQIFTIMAQVLARYGIATTWGLFKMDRSFMTMDAALRELRPTVDYPAQLRRYYRQRQQRIVHTLISEPDAVRTVLSEIGETVSEYAVMLDRRARWWGLLVGERPQPSRELAAAFFRFARTTWIVIGLLLAATALREAGVAFRGIDPFVSRLDWFQVWETPAGEVLTFLGYLIGLAALGNICRIYARWDDDRRYR
jgi:ubiquinone biosynthesis protein